MSDGYKEIAVSREHWDAKRKRDYDALAAQYLDACERLAAAESREACTVAHDNVETCGYCQRDALATRLAAAERVLRKIANGGMFSETACICAARKLLESFGLKPDSMYLRPIDAALERQP